MNPMNPTAGPHADDPGGAITSAPAWRREWLLANVWLFFLVFPAASVLADDLSSGDKVIALALIGLFAVIHMFAYRGLIHHELGLNTPGAPNRDGWWFAALVAVCTAAFVFGGWSILAMVPFIVTFAIFHFSWSVSIAVGATCLAFVVVAPAAAGVLTQAWIFSVLVLSVGGVAAVTRLNDESQGERSLLLTELAVSDERDRVARDVHDVLGHSLTVVILKTQVCDRLMESMHSLDDTTKVVDQTRAQLAEIESVSRRALAEIRATVGGLRTVELGDELAAARVVLADAGIALTVHGDVNTIPPQHRPVLAWVVRESVTNIIRHSRANGCTIDVAPEDDRDVLMRISDDGVGIGGSPPGNGLAGLQERADEAGVRLRITSVHGTEIEVAASTREMTV